MNDELPYAIGYNAPLTSWVIAGPYAGSDEAAHGIGVVARWSARMVLLGGLGSLFVWLLA